MFISYRESVLDYMGADGTLAPRIIQQLLDEHSLLDSLDDIRMELGDMWDDAETLLDWMGY